IFAGRDRSIVMLVSTYVALAVVTNTPYINTLNRALNASANQQLQLVWFVGMFALVFFILWKSDLMRNLGFERGIWWESILFSLCQVGLTVSSALYLLPPEAAANLSPMFRQLFLSDEGRSVWLLAPIVLLFTLGRSTGWSLFGSRDDDE
ncbi:MAG TPA: hypothetical protein VMU11_01055, partial [Verrucomicrobiae bacterium]|nr:hypothetical protein [Verrucomicrobiae bacterium]